MTLPLHTYCKTKRISHPTICKLVDITYSNPNDLHEMDFAYFTESYNHACQYASSVERPLVILGSSVPDNFNGKIAYSVEHPERLAANDIIKIYPNGRINILIRNSDPSNSLFVTESCNSKCIFCSQPPRNSNGIDINEDIIQIIPLIDSNLNTIGITGGEPTLLEDKFVDILHNIKHYLPNTYVHILSNGRKLSSRDLSRELAEAASENATWGIPLYSHSKQKHDYLVQTSGAFIETIRGIYNIAAFRQKIEIRFVLTTHNAYYLKEYVEFIWRNMPFIDHLAIMAIEPIGYAKYYFHKLWIEPYTVSDDLMRSLEYLEQRGIHASLYNFPLCTIPVEVHRFAKKSISQWKTKYLDTCEMCSLKKQCCGLFSSSNTVTTSKMIHALCD